MGALLFPVQVWVQKLPPTLLDFTSALSMSDFKNAFSSIMRDKMLEAAKLHIPELFFFVYSCSIKPFLPSIFTTPSSALQKGVQQGDPLGPLLFYLVIFPLTQMLCSEFHIFYLDDAILGGNEGMYVMILR